MRTNNLFKSFAVVSVFATASFAVSNVAVAQRVNSSAPTGSTYSQAISRQDVPKYDTNAVVQQSVSNGRLGINYTSVYSGGSSTAVKPFANTSHRPTISPYLNLLRSDEGGAAPNYHAFVRPQLQQNRVNQQQTRRNQTVYRQLQSIQSRPAFPTQGSQRMYPTGHRTLFLNHMHFYPSQQQRR